MSIIPCDEDKGLRAQIERFAEALKTEAHRLGNHGLTENEFYNSGLFRGAIERVRGQFSATMRGKREFVQHILNHMEDGGFIAGWELTEDGTRNDYRVRLTNQRIAIIDLKGCLDGNNTNIFERPADADEFIVWSLCTNPGADPRRNAWSGIHTRLGAEMMARSQRVDGLVVWDMVCGTIGRPCPKAQTDPSRLTNVGPFRVPPACIYVFPAMLPTVSMPLASAQPVANVGLLDAFHRCFGGRDDEVNFVDFFAETVGVETTRKTTVTRGGVIQKESDMTPIRRA